MSGIYEVGAPEEEIFGTIDFVRALERRVERDFELISQQLLTGQVDGFDGYKYKVGVLRGLEMVTKHIKELRQK